MTEILVNVYHIEEKRLFISEKRITFNLMWPTRVHSRTDHSGTRLQMSDFTEGWLSVSLNTFNRVRDLTSIEDDFPHFQGVFNYFLALFSCSFNFCRLEKGQINQGWSQLHRYLSVYYI